MIPLEAGDYRLDLDAGRGGCVLRFEWRGHPLMRPASGPGILDAASFPLVPFSNRIAHGRFRAGSREVALSSNFPGSDHPHPLHGFGWLAAWEVVRTEATEAVLEHRHDAGEWPWSYRARQIFQLGADGLTMTLELTNLSRDAMPAGLGFHPYFPRDPDTVYRGLHKGEWLTSPDCLPTSLREADMPVDWWDGGPAASRTVDTAYSGRSGPLVLTWPSRGYEVIMTPGDELPVTVVYTPAGEDYLCVEPVSHITDAHNRDWDEAGLIHLAPAGTMHARVRLKARPIDSATAGTS